jgi:hypothetical protein
LLGETEGLILSRLKCVGLASENQHSIDGRLCVIVEFRWHCPDYFGTAIYSIPCS